MRVTELTVSNVSRVLNSRGYISVQTRSKVNEAMKKPDYQPIKETAQMAIKLVKEVYDGKIAPRRTMHVVSLVKRATTKVQVCERSSNRDAKIRK